MGRRGMQKVKELMPEVPIEIYTGTPQQSLRLLYWWLELHETGDIKHVMFPDSQGLGDFINLFQSGSCKLAFGVGEEGKIKVAMWGQQGGPGIGFVSYWMSKSFRQHPYEGLAYTFRLYQLVFGLFDVIFGVTCQEGMQKVHEKMGYELVGEFPRIWSGERWWLWKLGRDDFCAMLIDLLGEVPK